MLFRGTAYFCSVMHAVSYYAPYGYTREDVRDKLRNKEIHLGKPTIQQDEELRLDGAEGRYWVGVHIETAAEVEQRRVATLRADLGLPPYQPEGS